jgi:hypothetical protein
VSLWEPLTPPLSVLGVVASCVLSVPLDPEVSLESEVPEEPLSVEADGELPDEEPSVPDVEPPLVSCVLEAEARASLAANCAAMMAVPPSPAAATAMLRAAAPDRPSRSC